MTLVVGAIGPDGHRDDLGFDDQIDLVDGIASAHDAEGEADGPPCWRSPTTSTTRWPALQPPGHFSRS